MQRRDRPTQQVHSRPTFKPTSVVKHFDCAGGTTVANCAPAFACSARSCPPKELNVRLQPDKLLGMTMGQAESLTYRPDEAVTSHDETREISHTVLAASATSPLRRTTRRPLPALDASPDSVGCRSGSRYRKVGGCQFRRPTRCGHHTANRCGHSRCHSIIVYCSIASKHVGREHGIQAAVQGVDLRQ